MKRLVQDCGTTVNLYFPKNIGKSASGGVLEHSIHLFSFFRYYNKTR